MPEFEYAPPHVIARRISEDYLPGESARERAAQVHREAEAAEPDTGPGQTDFHNGEEERVVFFGSDEEGDPEEEPEPRRNPARELPSTPCIRLRDREAEAWRSKGHLEPLKPDWVDRIGSFARAVRGFLDRHRLTRAKGEPRSAAPD